ncbi:MAG: hypothetical protein HYV63_12380 [Candidatus Schekmanbacteria bacterium]|nr:hypothetical protein [Candidatus Schekmanbacteria bacterium]
MASELDIRAERVDDIPLLIHLQDRMGLPSVVDRALVPHGNRGGLSFGWLLTTWLTYILSEADHRMCRVEDWAASHLSTLRAVLAGVANVEPQAKDFADDRLADLLWYLADEASWAAIERELGQRIIRVYDLAGQPLRLDATTASSYRAVDPDGLFRLGHSKDHRPDLAQLKLMMATVDPLGLPIATLVVAGNSSDDILYVPVIERTKGVVVKGPRLFVADCKMSAVATRAHIAAAGDRYVAALEPDQSGAPVETASRDAAAKTCRRSTVWWVEVEVKRPDGKKEKTRPRLLVSRSSASSRPSSIVRCSGGMSASSSCFPRHWRESSATPMTSA